MLINLNAKEARVLRIILDRVGGHPDKTSRGVADDIRNKLSAAMYKANVGIVPWPESHNILVLGRDAIYFHGHISEVDYGREPS